MPSLNSFIHTCWNDWPVKNPLETRRKKIDIWLLSWISDVAKYEMTEEDQIKSMQEADLQEWGEKGDKALYC